MTAQRRPSLTVLPLCLLGAMAWTAPDRHALWAAWLAAWWWCLGLVLGALMNGWLHRLTGGRWGDVLRPATAAIARRWPAVLLLGLPLGFGLPRLYPWWPAAAGWLQPHAFLLRWALYVVVFAWLARTPWPARKGHAAFALMAVLGLGTLAAVDGLMSLMPPWTSTAFGLVVLASMALGGAALTVLVAARATPRAVASGLPPAGRDLGHLMLMWALLWAYLAFMQWLIVWAGNLPREIVWYLPRVNTGWRWAALALVLGLVLLPLALLLPRAVKDHPSRLGAVAALLLATQALEVGFNVLPSVVPHSPWAPAWALLLALAMGTLLFGPLLQRPLEARPHAPR